MKNISKVLSLDRYTYYLKHLEIINVFLPVKMTSKEQEVIASFMSFEGDIKEAPFSSLGSKLVRERVGINSAGGLGNYIDSLKKKGFILSDMTINPVIVPSDKEQIYKFKIVIKEDE